MAGNGDTAFVNYIESIMHDPDLSRGAKHAAIGRALRTRGGDTEQYQHYLRALEDESGRGDADPPGNRSTLTDK